MHAALAALLLLAASGEQLVILDKGDQKVALAGVCEPQVHDERDDGRPRADSFQFRRLIAEAQVTASPDWSGDLQIDFGQSAVTLRNAYVQYGGWRTRGLALLAGHMKVPFSRSNITSGTKRETPERPFTGDRNFGVPNRIAGARVDGASPDRRVQWSAAVGLQHQIVNARRITFDSPTAAATLLTTTGRLVAGRAEWHPFGDTPRDQGDFHTGGWRAVVGMAAFRWQNDHRRVTATGADLAHVTGGEASVGVRGHGVSFDAELHRTQGIASDGTLTRGIFRKGVGAIHTASVEAGYMLPRNRIEIVSGYDSFEALAYSHQWRRFSTGANAYLRGQNLKVQVATRTNRHIDGGSARGHELFAELQVLF